MTAHRRWLTVYKVGCPATQERAIEQVLREKIPGLQLNVHDWGCERYRRACTCKPQMWLPAGEA